MVTQPNYVTARGYAKLRRELDQLESEKMPALVDLLQETAVGTDGSDNTEMQSLQVERELITIRINTLRDVLNNAQLIAPEGPNDTVQIGATVTLQERGEAPERFTIVGSAEADPEEGLISNVSPLGQALFGRKQHDTITLETDGGIIVYQILLIQTTD